MAKTIELEFTPEEMKRLKKLQPDESKLPALAQELTTKAVRNHMARMPGRVTRQEGDA